MKKSLRDWAITYARAGFKIFPCKLKNPDGQLVPHGFRDATSDEATIDVLWTGCPDANIGLVPPSGMAIVDVDFDRGGKRTSEMVPTLEAISGGGNLHLFYKDAPANLPGKFAEGVEIKTSSSGYVIAAPSRHKSGRKYKWDGEFDVGRIQPWPSGLVPRTDRPAAAKLNGDHLPLTPSQIAWCLDRISADEEPTWVNVAMALKADYPEHFDWYLAWSATATRRKNGELVFKGEADCQKTWDRINGEGYTTRSLKFWAEENFGETMPKSTPEEDGFTKVEVDILDAKKRSGPRSGQELLMKKFKPIRWAVQNILPEGLYILAAPPKIGKSWLALQIALAVGGGGEVLGETAEQGGVLFIALEDSDRRLQSRLNKLGAVFEDVAQVFFETVWPRVDQGGIKQLDQWLQEHPTTRYVVIDVLERFRARRSAKDNAYSADYEAITSLKPLCDKYHVTILVVHHTRKLHADDPLDMVSGTQGLSGGADGVLVLKRPRGKDEGELHIMSRDLEQEGAYVVMFDRTDCHWLMVGETSEVSKSITRREILDVLEKAGKPLGPSEVATLTNRTKQAVFKLLQGLIEEGIVCNVKGQYAPIKNIDRVDGVFG